MTDTTVCGVPLHRMQQFFGAHAYLVTQRGASTLLDNTVPIDHQADGLMLTLSDLGWLRLYGLPRSVASQCLNGEDKQGAWHTHTTAETETTIQQRPTASAVQNGWLFVLLLFTVVVGYDPETCGAHLIVPVDGMGRLR